MSVLVNWVDAARARTDGCACGDGGSGGLG